MTKQVLVDTSVWSLALRRAKPVAAPEVQELQQLIAESRVELMGPIRQEILSGIRETTQFERLKQRLRAFPDLRLTTSDFELAAEFFNMTRRHGIQGSGVDFLICAVATNRNLTVLTTNKDFSLFQQYISLELHTIRE